MVALATYIIGWLDYNRRALNAALENLGNIDQKLETYAEVELKREKLPGWLRIISYGTTVFILAAVAIVVIYLAHWCECFSRSSGSC